MSSPKSQINDNNNQELQYMIVLFRHGDRTAIRRYPFETVQWKWDYGKLTISGMKQAFKFGQYLQPKVGQLLKREPEVDDVEVYSTDFDRTYDTANCVLLGLYTKGQDEVKLQDNFEECKECRPNGTRSNTACLSQCMSLKQPPPLTPPIKEVDNRILVQMDYCKGWWEDIQRLESSSFWNLMSKKNFESALKFVQTINGDEPQLCQTQPVREKMCQDINLDAVERVWGNLQCSIAHDSTYIEGYKNEYVDSMLREAALYVWHSRFNSTHGQKVGKHAGGILLSEILGRLQKFSDGQMQEVQPAQNDSRIVFYSAHDTTIMSLLSALQTSTSVHIPQYVSHVIFELWRDVEEGQPYVHISYDNQPLDWFACPGAECMLEDLISATADFTMSIDECVEAEHSF
eukprot:TRINITY_DN6408_c0_g1_i3.p1 TRINITY_DN6408_c0_g1~~TRINITY_DN6408_c0_g1_i3.p1  ORF type:complete len:402 (-),score=42.13 TRINITY_DN6408_c0_g1_i3:1389-2594(-)